MDRLLEWLRARRPSPAVYEPLPADSLGNSVASLSSIEPRARTLFSWIEYGIFTLLGVAMLWGWNMYLAAAPYFEGRFASSDWLHTHFQPAIMSVFTITNAVGSWLLAKKQRNASYPRRIIVALILSVIASTLLALSTSFHTSAEVYFAFVIVTVFVTSLSTASAGNGLLAIAAGFGNSEYTQAVMTGQGIAGVLPAIVEIIAVLSVPQAAKNQDEVPKEDPSSAFAYFLTAAAIGALSLAAFLYLMRRNPDRQKVNANSQDDEGAEDIGVHYKDVSMMTLLKKLRWFAVAVTITFMVTMVYPVFTEEILSNRDPATAPRLFQPSSFIPLGFLVWNTGDLIGRLLPLWNRISGIHYPFAMFIFAIARVGFIPLYELCNIRGRGAVVPSDTFYLFVQLFFGITSGYVGSSCMMATPGYVEPAEREAAGGFMGFMLVLGLTVGSLLSFSFAVS